MRSHHWNIGLGSVQASDDVGLQKENQEFLTWHRHLLLALVSALQFCERVIPDTLKNEKSTSILLH